MLEDYEADSEPDSVPKNIGDLLPCHFLPKPYMRSSDARMQTFSKNWSTKDCSTP